eukprot:scaffold24452_cov61-Phaeocystis_antarctica.AAC.4
MPHLTHSPTCFTASLLGGASCGAGLTRCRCRCPRRLRVALRVARPASGCRTAASGSSTAMLHLHLLQLALDRLQLRATNLDAEGLLEDAAGLVVRLDVPPHHRPVEPGALPVLLLLADVVVQLLAFDAVRQVRHPLGLARDLRALARLARLALLPLARLPLLLLVLLRGLPLIHRLTPLGPATRLLVVGGVDELPGGGLLELLLGDGARRLELGGDLALGQVSLEQLHRGPARQDVVDLLIGVARLGRRRPQARGQRALVLLLLLRRRLPHVAVLFALGHDQRLAVIGGDQGRQVVRVHLGYGDHALGWRGAAGLGPRLGSVGVGVGVRVMRHERTLGEHPRSGRSKVLGAHGLGLHQSKPRANKALARVSNHQRGRPVQQHGLGEADDIGVLALLAEHPGALEQPVEHLELRAARLLIAERVEPRLAPRLIVGGLSARRGRAVDRGPVANLLGGDDGVRLVVGEPLVQPNHREALRHRLRRHLEAALAPRDDAERDGDRPEDGRAKVAIGALAVLRAALGLLGPLQARHARDEGEGVGLVGVECQLARHARPAQPPEPHQRLVEAIGRDPTNAIVADRPMVKGAQLVLQVALVGLRALLLVLGLLVVVSKRARLLVVAGNGAARDAALAADELVVVDAHLEPAAAVLADVGGLRCSWAGGRDQPAWQVRELLRLEEPRIRRVGNARV